MSSANHPSYDINKLPISKGKRFALVVSEWNEKITKSLQEGAKKLFLEAGVNPKDIEDFFVPGSFELIHGCKIVSESLEFDAVIAIGSLIKGETDHFEFVAQAVANGIADLNANGKTPVIFCVLTDDDIQQSIDRSGGQYGNKGTEAAIAAIKMSNF